MTRPAALLAMLLTLFLAGCTREPPAETATVPGPPPDWKALRAEAEALAAQGLFVEAGNAIRARWGSLPADKQGEAALVMARSYHRGNVFDLALKHADAAIAVGVGTAEAHFLRGDSQRALFQAGAEKTLEEALRLAPGHARSQLALARLRFRSTDPAAALPLFEAYFKTAPSDDPDYRLALLEHGRALRAARRHQEAADRFMLLLEDEPLEGPFYSELAASLYRLQLREEGRFVEEIYKLISQSAFEEHVEDRLRETGATAFALGQRAVNRTRQRRYLEAFQSYRQAIRAAPAEARLRNFHADLCIEFRRFHEARRDLEDAIQRRLEPSSGIWWMKGRLHLAEEKPAEALEAFEAAAAALAREGDQGGQERGQAPAFSLNLSIARAAIENGAHDQALKAIDRAAAAAPQSWEPLYWRGRIDLARGDAPGALARFAEAEKRGGGTLMDLSYHAALALARVDRGGEAVARLEAITKSQPGFVAAHERLVELAGDAGAKSVAGEGLARAKGFKAELSSLTEKAGGKPLEQAALEYLAMGKVAIQLKDPKAFDWLFLASDLLPSDAEACRLLIAGMKRSQDVFVRAHYLRRLLRVTPDDPGALQLLAEIYLKLRVRLDEAASMADRVHARTPSAQTYRLVGEIAFLRGDRARAVAILRQGSGAHPADPGIQEALRRVEGGGGKEGK